MIHELVKNMLQYASISDADLYDIAKDMIKNHSYPYDITETCDRYKVYVHLSGVPKESLKVTCSNNTITITGNRPIPYKTDTTSISSTVMYGPVDKTLILPVHIDDRNDISVDIEDGVLVIEIFKVQSSERSITFTLNKKG